MFNNKIGTRYTYQKRLIDDPTFPNVFQSDPVSLKETIQRLVTRFPTATIAFITPMKCNCTMQHFRSSDDYPLQETFTQNPANLTLVDYHEAMLKVLDYYSIPYLDLFSEACFSPYFSQHITNFTKDGLHCTDAGYALLAKRIASFMNSL